MLGKNIYCRRAHIFLIIYHSCFKGMQILFKMYSHFLKYFRIICFELNLQEEHHLHFHMVCNTLKPSAAICSHILQSFTFIVYFKQSSQFDVCFVTYTPSVTLYSCVGLLLLPENFAGFHQRTKKLFNLVFIDFQYI